ncbi:rho guanine nucleotide exchange factor 7 isoform X2 [Patella vulgata]|uniref:rho guanine nucleotide exchange factor 7 isoform X2 n=1 Tax=Patella vulgata TaxID=6465 RepID=UPI0024A99241|nr:rho guanine nucleotide exchange factor 7 isoform X2 [Patella vulgata]
MTEGGPKHVKSLHNFKGSNNDELCFEKGEIITVTQALDGGWWEGTLKGKTGWFPSNYVKDFKSELGHGTGMKSNRNSDMSVIKRESMQLYHNVVLKNVIETERTHVAEITKVLKTYLLPLQSTGILNVGEFCQLIGNLEDIAAFQPVFLASLEECEKLPPSQRRIGGVFLTHAEQLRNLYIQYCANHPLAVSVLQRHRDELSRYMENLGVPVPGSMTLTTNLSKAFTRLEKYPSLLKELERHIEESHPDRGDTQRAIAVYRDIANSCMEIRKLKEMELEIVASSIKDWEGDDITKLGEVIHLSQVKLHNNTGEKFERIFVLFPHCLVMLSMSPRLSGYQYEGKLPLSGLIINRCESGDKYPNGFEISGNMIEPMVITCGTKLEVSSWVEILRQQIKQALNTGSTKPQSLQISQSQPSISTLTPAKTAKVSQTPVNIYKSNSTWSMSCLRPFPPMRPSLACREDALKSPKAARKSVQSKRKPVRTHSGDEYDYNVRNKYDPKVYNEDAFILEVIEAYHNSAKTRHTLTSFHLNPQVLVVEDEKIMDVDGGLSETTLVDTVYSLKDKVKGLEQEQKKLKRDVEDGKKDRKRLELMIKKLTGTANLDFNKDEVIT